MAPMINTSNVARLPSSVLQEIASKGIVKHFPARTLLIHEGDASSALFIVIEGRVKTYVENDEGKKATLGFHGPGEYVGEMAVDGGERNASVVTMEPTTCAVVTGIALQDFIATHPEFATHLIHELIKRVRALTQNVKGLALEDVYRRVARLLQRMSMPDGDERIVPRRITHLEIAEVVGSSREMVSRIFKDLKVGGYVELRSGLIVLRKKLPPAW